MAGGVYGRPEASEKLKQVVSRFPTPRKGSNKLFQGFRGLGKAQTSCFKVSETSERPKQVVSRFPTRRKGSNRLFQDFRGLGASGTPAKFAGYGLLRYPANFPASEEAVRDAGQVCRVRAFEVPGLTSQPRKRPSGTPAKFAGYGLLRYPG
ncbi:hypothetical protein C7123_03370 [Tannerella serpentiformis]|nr:hypothetical protein C7123_03370 [Tannerella serpentiformis]AWB15196.1 hypothetical protein BCB71_12720 [Tannerella serpentiformis]